MKENKQKVCSSGWECGCARMMQGQNGSAILTLYSFLRNTINLVYQGVQAKKQEVRTHEELEINFF